MHLMNNASSWNMGALLLNSSFNFSTYFAPDATDLRCPVSPSSPGHSAGHRMTMSVEGRNHCRKCCSIWGNLRPSCVEATRDAI